MFPVGSGWNLNAKVRNRAAQRTSGQGASVVAKFPAESGGQLCLEIDFEDLGIDHFIKILG
jgi:hypothetical protein